MSKDKSRKGFAMYTKMKVFKGKIVKKKISQKKISV